MKRVLIESPYRATFLSKKELHLTYLRACILDSLERGEAPFASHGFYTRYLNDKKPAEREAGMACGKAWAEGADVIAFYVDYGISPGMVEMLDWVFTRGLYAAGHPIPETRKLPDWFDEEKEKEGDLG